MSYFKSTTALLTCGFASILLSVPYAVPSGGGSGALGPRAMSRPEPLESPRALARSLASADFDEDGVADLISGYDDAGRGVIALHLGDPDALYPNAPEARQRRAEDGLDPAAVQPFHAPAVFDLPEAADFVGAGDFDNDGHMDVVAGASGGSTLYLLPGDGHGAFGDPKRRTLPGTLTALAAGEMDKPDGLADFAVALVRASGSPEIEVFESPLGAWKAQPESFAAGAPVTRLAMGDLDRDFLGDLSAAAGEQLVVVRGRDRKLSLGVEARATALQAHVDRLPIGSPEASLALSKAPAEGRAMLPMRLDGDALDDLVMLQEGGPSSLSIGGGSSLTTFTVTNTNDSGAGSLRAAILGANGTLGADMISFNIPGSAPYVISPLSPLPDVIDPVTIDGTTQPGFAGTPLIQIDGTSAGLGADGLLISSGSTIVRGLVVRDFDGNGIRLRSGGGNRAEGCYVGTDVTGVLARPNHQNGIKIENSSTNTIGGTAPGARNVISANQANGVEIDPGPGVSATFHSTDVPKAISDFTTTSSLVNALLTDPVIDVKVTVRILHTYDGDLRLTLISPDGTHVDLSLNNGGSGDNYLGTVFDDAGTVPITAGVAPFTSPPSYIPQSPLSAFIGGPSGGPWMLEVADTAAGDAGELQAWSIQFTTSPAFNNQILGNFIGTDASGSSALGNQRDGVRIVNSPANNVGSPGPGARNVISGNVVAGIETILPGATKNMIQGNYIGTDRTGGSALPQTDGVYLRSDQNLVGGTASGAGNVVSGNGSTVYEVGVHVTGNGNLVQGNFLGTDATGTASVPNGYVGVEIEGSFNTVGGGVAGAGNLISGNALLGVVLGIGGGNNAVQGNLIGTRIGGTAALGNGTAGINVLDSTGNLIGGSAPDERNVISANPSGGVALNHLASIFGGNRVEGNYIGTDITGMVALGNGYNGVTIATESNVVGGPAGSGKGNVISGSGQFGVGFNARARLNQVMGNIIGLDAAANAPIPNTSDGVGVGGFDNTIGGGGPGEGNVISGNGGAGVQTYGFPDTTTATYTSSDVPKAIPDVSVVTSTLVLSDPSIVEDVDLQLSLTHTFDGDLRITLYGPDGTAVPLSNRRGGSGDNFSGTSFDDEGSAPIASGSPPFASPPSYVPEGPLAALDGISAAGTWTLQIEDLASGDVGTLSSWSLTLTTPISTSGAGNRILGNMIGTDGSGTLPRGNAGPGVLINNSAGNRIGDAAAGSGNLISSNQQGIEIMGAGSLGNLVTGNLVGTQFDGISPLGNLSDGVLVTSGAFANRIGAATGGTIAFNGGAGVRVESGRSNAITSNSIHSNAGLGIDLDAPGVNPNDPGDVDVGPNDRQNYPAITAAPMGGSTLIGITFSSLPNQPYLFHFYSNTAPDPTGFGEGKTYFVVVVGLTTDSAGNISQAFLMPGVHNFVTATATDPAHNTSEFSEVVKTVLEASPAKDMVVEKSGALLKVTYTPACGATDHVIYWGMAGPAPMGPAGISWISAACGMGISGTAFFDPGILEPGHAFYFVIAGQNSSVEGSYGQDSSGFEEPEATLPIVCDRAQYLGGICY